jgi:hypothetical protein
VAEQEGTFARLRMSGGRFEHDGMPVEALGELVAYRDLVVGVATEIFRATHSDRQRLPAGFADRLQLRLQTVERGSAVPVLERMNAPGTMLTPADEFTEARDMIAEAVAAVASGDDLPAAFPRSALVLFNRFGQTLRADEAIELRSGTASRGPRYTQEVRRQLVLETRSVYQDEVHDIAWVTEVDGQHMRCQVRLRGGPPGPVPAPLDEITFEPLKAVLEPNGAGPPVYISGTGVFDSRRTLTRLDSVHDIGPVPEDLAAIEGRLSSMKAARDGWLDGDGLAPAAPALDKAYRTLAELLRLDVPRPRLYPTADGGVQAEWSTGRFEVSITFDAGGAVFAAATDTETGGDEELKDAAAELLARLILRAT